MNHQTNSNSTSHADIFGPYNSNIEGITRTAADTRHQSGRCETGASPGRPVRGVSTDTTDRGEGRGAVLTCAVGRWWGREDGTERDAAS